ncbi:hypothetical protein V8C86DRAFT_2441243 [Haematococcus lacustris]
MSLDVVVRGVDNKDITRFAANKFLAAKYLKNALEEHKLWKVEISVDGFGVDVKREGFARGEARLVALPADQAEFTALTVPDENPAQDQERIKYIVALMIGCMDLANSNNPPSKEMMAEEVIRQVLKARATWNKLSEEGQKEYSKGYVAATKHYPGLSAVGVYGAGVPEGMECLMTLYDIYSNSKKPIQSTPELLATVIEGVQYTPQSKDCVAAILNGLEDKVVYFNSMLKGPPAHRQVALITELAARCIKAGSWRFEVGTVEQQSDGINCAHYVLAMVYAFVNQLDMGYANKVNLSRVNITKQRQDVTESIKAAMAVIGPEAAMFPTAPVASPPQYKDVLRASPSPYHRLLPASCNRPAPGQYLSLHPWPISGACPCPYPCPHQPPSDPSPYPGTSTSSCPGGMPISATCSQQAASNTSPRPEPCNSSRP